MFSSEGSWYSPRLLLSLIFELSPDSRFAAARRPDPSESGEWRTWSSRTFQNQLLTSVSNWSQLNTIGSVNWEKGKQPKYDPITTPADRDPHEGEPPSIFDFFNVLSGAAKDR